VGAPPTAGRGWRTGPGRGRLSYRGRVESLETSGQGVEPPPQRYEIRGTLGSGGVGVVYRAFDHARGSEVALKTLRRTGALDLYRFKREFRALADIVHPNLASLYELHTVDDEWFFTMELVEGRSFIEHVRPHDSLDDAPPVDGVTRTVQPRSPRASDPGPSLRDHVRQRIVDAPLDHERLEAAFYQLVDGVHAIHLAGKLHRDLKPSNVLVDGAGRLVLLDFGLVAELATDGLHSQGGNGAVTGTPAYMSPEQATGGALDEASDWYSVGVMLYEALTGRRPFEGPAAEILAAKQEADPVPPRERAPDTPAYLDRLCRGLLARDPAQRPDAAAIFAALGRAPSPATAQLAGAATPFVGRGAELATLEDAFDACRHGRGIAVFVRGASGIGKSALVRAFLDDLGDRALVLDGRCYQRESVPYKALDSVVDALTSELARTGERELRQLLPRDTAVLARLFPVLRRVPAIAAPVPFLHPPDPLEIRRSGFAALRLLLERLAATRPVVVAIDDLQWGDGDSAAFLADLVHRPGPHAILVIATHRSEDEATSAVLALVKKGRGASEAPAGAIRELTVEALPEADALALLAGVDGDGDLERRRALVRDCGGSPFFLTELARGPGLTGAAGLDALLQEHVARLPADARALLQLCAVAARPLATDVALRAAHLEREGSAVATLRAERLVRVHHGRDQQGLEPYHDRIREAVVAGLDAGERRRLHRALAEELEADGARDHDALVAHWFEAGEPARAGAHAALAAAAAEEALAFDQAARLYAIALDHAAITVEARQAMLVRRAHALSSSGKVDEAADAFASAAAGATGEAALELRRLSVEQRLRAGEYEPALAEMAALLAAVGYRPPTSRAGAIASLLGQSLILAVRRERPRRLGRVDPAVDRRIHVLHSLATGMAFVNPVLGRVLQFRLMRDALTSGDPRHMGIALSMSFGYLGSAGVHTMPRVEALYRRGCEVAAELGDPVLEAWFLGGYGFAIYLFGRWAEALDHMRRASAIMRENQGGGQRWQLDVMEIYIPAALWYRGDIAELVRVVPQSVREAQERGDRLAERGLRSWRGNAAWLVMGRPDEAEAHVDAVVPPRGPGETFQLKHYYELLARAQIDLYRGDPARAHQRIVGAWRELERSLILKVQSVRVEGWYLRGRSALAAAGAGDRRLLADAERAARRIDRERTTWGRPFALALWAALDARRGDDDGAREHMAAAAEAFAEADMALYGATARRRLGELIGGDEGAALVADADAVMRAGTVADPTAMARMLLPGW
jgi:serine/threonine protein kinase